jgi:hypothetical protein
MLTREQISCVTARVGETGPERLALADIVADHRTGSASPAVRAAMAFARLPGCEIFLAPEDRDGYLAFARCGRCFSIRPAGDRGRVPAGAAEACAVVLYAAICAACVPPNGFAVTLPAAHAPRQPGERPPR